MKLITNILKIVNYAFFWVGPLPLPNSSCVWGVFFSRHPIDIRITAALVDIQISFISSSLMRREQEFTTCIDLCPLPIQKRLWDRYFLVNFEKLLTTSSDDFF